MCPGSRNALIVHNLSECPQIECYPVTDERSAGFFALGLALEDGRPSPVAVCVTSGTALLNLLPAVAEAFYQHVPLVIISADRPQQLIGQLDGQTLPQPDALGRFVRKAVHLPICSSHCDEDRWYCNRLVNEALLAMRFPMPAPVHINVPIDEPLFAFDVPELPDERVIQGHFSSKNNTDAEEYLLETLKHARRPMVVIGQTNANENGLGEALERLSERVVLLTERLCNYSVRTVHFDEVLHSVGNDTRYQPDVVICIGDCIVSKRLKKFLRAGEARMILLNEDGNVNDTFMHLEEIVVCNPEHALLLLAQRITRNRSDGIQRADGNLSHTVKENQPFVSLWHQSLNAAAAWAETFSPPYSQMAAVKLFENTLSRVRYIYKVHYANSTSVRLANIYARHPVYCNRGVNGIEGSLSTAAGMSAKSQEMVFCVIGDLSFFYDQNALWNQNLQGNLRIMLLNNGQGGIFRQLKGLDKSPVCDTFVAGQHQTHAEGICRQNSIDYQIVEGMDELQASIDWLLQENSHRPRLLEVVTDVETDRQTLASYYNK